MKGYKTNSRVRLGEEFYNAGHEFFGDDIHPNILASIEMNQGIFTEIEVPDVQSEGNVKEIEAEDTLNEASADSNINETSSEEVGGSEKAAETATSVEKATKIKKSKKK